MRRLRCVPRLCVFRVPCQRWQGKIQLMCTKRPLYWESWGKIKFAKKAFSDALLISRFENLRLVQQKIHRLPIFPTSPLLNCAHVTTVAGLNFLPGKVSDSPNFFSEFSFPNSVLLCFFLGPWSGFINLSLQSSVNQHSSQTIERLFSKKKY